MPHPRRRCRVTVDLAAIAANWRTFARLGAAEAAAVVKADAYGLGADQVAPALAAAGARTFFVASLGEALAVRQALGHGPEVFVLEGPAPGEAPHFAAAGVTPVVNSAEQAATWASEAHEGGACALHIDTGMGRLGLAPTETGEVAARLGPRVRLVMSHLACAGDPSHPQNARQRDRFLTATAELAAVRRSLAATAGALLGPDYAFDVIRPGIGLYGHDDRIAPGGPRLAPVVRVEAPILQVFDLAPGDTVGYGATFVAERPMRAAVVAAGYADGVLRASAGRGYAALHDVRCAILGRVSMDLLTLDVTAAGAAAVPGGWVELVGPSAPLAEIAAAAGTMPYEILTGLRAAERRYVGGEP